MSKNYKLICYTEQACPPCEQMGTYPSSSAVAKGYQFEEVMLVRTTNGEDWIDKPLSDFMATPWFKLENLDDDTTVDSFYGGNKPRLDIMLEK